MLSVRLPKKLEDHLDALCAQTERSRSFYVKKALVRYFEDQAEMEWATKAYKEFVDSGKKTIPWENVKEELGF